MKIRNIVTVFLLSSSFTLYAQKITLGSCTTADGGAYQGEMSGGKPQGKGRAVYTNGDRYEGEYVKGKRQGQGTYTFSDGEKYEGEWFQDHQHGLGTFYFQNNNKYVGLWYADEQQGHGIMYYLMVMFTMASGKLISAMVMVNTLIKVVPPTKDNGRMT